MEEKISTRKWIYIVILFVIFLLISIFFFSFQITEVEVKGNNYYTDEQIIALTEFQEQYFESVILR